MSYSTAPSGRLPIAIDPSKLRPGDEVTVRLFEDAPRSHTGAIGFWSTPGSTCRFSIEVLAHKPAPAPPLKPGDKVKRGNGDIYEIIAGPRSTGPSDYEPGSPEYAVWSDKLGFTSEFALTVDTWERV